MIDDVTVRALPLPYEAPVLILSHHHAAHHVSLPTDYGYARTMVVAPLGVGEFAAAASYYPIVFAAGDRAQPLAVLGLTEGRNLFVGADGMWEAGAYIPAYVRRYPFILAQAEAPGRLMLAVERDSLVEAPDDASAPLFRPDGGAAPLLADAIRFCEAFEADQAATALFAGALVAQGLLTDRVAEIALGPDIRQRVEGFRQLDPEAIRRLDADTRAAWLDRDWTGLLTLVQASQAHWTRLLARATIGSARIAA